MRLLKHLVKPSGIYSEGPFQYGDTIFEIGSPDSHRAITHIMYSSNYLVSNGGHLSDIVAVNYNVKGLKGI